jgi:hypothetical protein
LVANCPSGTCNTTKVEARDDSRGRVSVGLGEAAQKGGPGSVPLEEDGALVEEPCHDTAVGNHVVCAWQ